MKGLPLVSVYMPTKNRLALLQEAIASVFKQSYKNIELHIVDDGSSDGTYQYLQNLAGSNNNVFIYRNENSKGACAARNLAVNNAKGEFVTGLDDDDIFLPERIADLVEAYDDSFAFICSSMWWDYGKRKKIIDIKEKVFSIREQLSYNEATSQVLVRRERFLEVGGFDESFVSCQDYDLWTRLMLKYGNAYRINKPTYVINDTGGSMRMIGDPRSVKGYEQYQDKFHKLMSLSNIKNQEFMRLRRRRSVMPLLTLLANIGRGHFGAKFKYFLSSNFRVIRHLHRSFYKEK